MIKRMFDLLASIAGLIILTPLFVVVALLIKINSSGPIFFKQQRMGIGFCPFSIYKFRTMVQKGPRKGRAITVGQDPRITLVGRILRKAKIDELPQLYNVLKGEMSFVGPRPEVRKYVEMFRRDYEEILSVRPGITDLASLKYRDEAAILGQSEKPEEDYVKRILPEKIRLAKEYLNRSTLAFDLILILKTVLYLMGRSGRV